MSGDCRRKVQVDNDCGEHFFDAKRTIKLLGYFLLTAWLAKFMTQQFQDRWTHSALFTVDNQLIDIISKSNNTLDHFEKTVEEISYLADNTEHQFNLLNTLLQKGGMTKEMHAHSNRLIKEKILIYDSDKTGLPDYALENTGACIVSVRDTANYEEPGKISKKYIKLPFSDESDQLSRIIIQPRIIPGECWHFKGQKGTVVIKLSRLIQVTAVSLEHVPGSMLVGDAIKATPRIFSLKGLSGTDDPQPFQFGDFVYQLNEKSVQTFQVMKTTKTFRYVEVSFHSNHGNPKYTCVYRIRIHGKSI